MVTYKKCLRRQAQREVICMRIRKHTVSLSEIAGPS